MDRIFQETDSGLTGAWGWGTDGSAKAGAGGGGERACLVVFPGLFFRGDDRFHGLRIGAEIHPLLGWVNKKAMNKGEYHVH